MKLPKLTLTLAVVMQYPKLNRPDVYEGNSPEFKVQGIVVDNDKNRAKIAQLQEHLDAHVAAQGKKRLEVQPFFYENDDGTLEFRFKNKVYERKADNSLFSLPIAVVDAKGKPLGTISFDAEGENHAEGVPAIGSGTKALINFEARPFKVGNKVGLQFKMDGIKIVELVEYRGGASFDDEDEDDFAEAPQRTASEDEVDDFL